MTMLKGQCHWDFAVFRPVWAKIIALIVSLLTHKMLLQNYEEDFFETQLENLKKIGKFFQVSIRFHPCYP